MTNFERFKASKTPAELMQRFENLRKCQFYHYMNIEKYMESEDENPCQVKFLNILSWRYVLKTDLPAPRPIAVPDMIIKEFLDTYMEQMPVIGESSFYGMCYYTLADIKNQRIIKVPDSSTVACETPPEDTV